MSLLMVRKSAPAHAADAAPKFRVGQEVIVKTKYAEPYKARIVGLWDMSQNGPYDEQGYLIKNIKGGGVESMPEHALSLVTAKDSAALDAKFKVGDLVRMSEGGLTGNITKIEPNGHFRVSFLYNKANGFSQSFSANEIVMVKPAKDAAAI